MVLTPEQARNLATSGKRFRQIQQEQRLTEEELKQVIKAEQELKPGLRRILARKRGLKASVLKGPGSGLQEKILRDRAKIVREVIGPKIISEKEARARAKIPIEKLGLEEAQRVDKRQQELLLESKKRDLNIGELRELGFKQSEIAEIGRKQLEAQEEARKIQKQKSEGEKLISRKKTIQEILGKRLTSEISKGFNKDDLEQIKKAKNKANAVKILNQLLAKKEKARKQKLNSFLKASVKEIKTEKDLKNLKKAIDLEDIRKKNKKLQAKIKLENINKKLEALEVNKNISLKDLVKTSSPDKAVKLLKTYKKAKPVLSKKEEEEFKRKILNTPVSVWKGAKDFEKEIINLLAIKPYNYGSNLVKRGLWSSNPDKNPLLKDAVDLIKKPVNIGKFVAKEPETAGILVAVGASNLKLDLSKKFDKDPARTLTKVLLEWYSPTIGLKTAKLANKKIIIPSKNLIKKVNPNLFNIKTQWSRTNFDVDTNLVKGSAQIDLKTEGLLEDGRNFIANSRLRLKEGEAVQGNMKIRTDDGKVFTKEINLKDEGAFYIDKATGEKIPKSTQPVKDVKVKINETKQGFKLDGDLFQLGGTKVIQKRQFLKLAGTNVEKGKGGAIKFKLKPTGLEILKRLKVKGDPISIYKKPVKKRTTKDYDRALKFLEAIDYDSVIAKGLDRRLKLARELGLNKSDSLKLVKGVEKDIESGMIIVRKAKASASGNFETIKPQKFAIGPSFLLSKPKLILKYPKKLKKNKVGDIEVPQEIRIPELDSLIYLPRKLPKGVKIPKKYINIAGRLGLLRYYDFEGLNKSQKDNLIKIVNKFKTPAKEIIKKPIKVKVPSKIKKPVKVKVPSKIKKPVNKQKKISKLKKPLKQVKLPITPKPKIKGVRKKIPLNIPELKDNKVRKAKVTLYEAFYRERKNRSKPFNKKTNPVIVKRLRVNSTPNRALEKVAKLADNRAVRSIQIKALKESKRNVKDIVVPKILNKFKFKSPKSNVLILVEKAKYAIDKPGEKRELKIARKMKKSVVPKKKRRKNTKKLKKN